MDIFKYVEKILGRKLYIVEERMVRSIYLARQRKLDREPRWVNTTNRPRYEQFAPIVDKYLEERANA